MTEHLFSDFYIILIVVIVVIFLLIGLLMCDPPYIFLVFLIFGPQVLYYIASRFLEGIPEGRIALYGTSFLIFIYVIAIIIVKCSSSFTILDEC